MTSYAIPRRGCECCLCRQTRGLEPLPQSELKARREARAERDRHKGRPKLEQHAQECIRLPENA